MELLLRDRAPRIWQRHDGPAALEAGVGVSDVILLCTPATALADLAATIRPWLAPAALVVTIAKGLDDAGRTPVEALHSALGAGRFAALYGPMISEEIRAGKPAFAQCGSADPQACARLGALFAGTALRLAPAADLAGLAWSAILKNVYALAFGMSDELGLGDNVRGFLAVAAAHEIDAAVRRHGGRAATAFHLAGLGDLITTATSRGSHHHELGRRLARGDAGELRGEGVHTLAMLRAHRRLEIDALPLLRLVDNCVRDPPGTALRWRDYLDRTRILGH
jgi:glycerol-3-phosphate dehydrogenase (NAD(P)+)